MIYARRDILRSLTAAVLLPPWTNGQSFRESKADVIILGGGTGGCAAAIAAARNGMSVIFAEETDWIGGQLTSQAVPPDEHHWIESFGATLTYRAFRSKVRDYYKQNYPLTAAARSQWNLNPGNGSVSRICHEPGAALAVLLSMLAPYVSSGQVRILPYCRPAEADIAGDAIRCIAVQNHKSGRQITLHGSYFLDATELGDLLPLTSTEYVTGFESNQETGELHAPSQAQPYNMQAFTVCFAMDYNEGEDHVIEKPGEYDYWKTYIPKLTPPWCGRLLNWETIHPITLKPRTMELNIESGPGWWRYRRIIDKNNFAPGTFQSDICLVNWPQNDYIEGNLCEVSENEKEYHIRRGKQLSLSLLYWIQTEAPRPDGGAGWRGIRLRPDVTGTEDGMAKFPYIRESRRIKAEFTVLEHHVGAEARMQLTGKSRDDLQSEAFHDSVGVGSYRIDLHPSSGGNNYIDIDSLPFQIPLGALIPQRMENMLPSCKNIGTTHITNGCYRLHPVEWNVGESAGMLAAYCVTHKCRPRQVRNSGTLLEDFQKFIMDQGVEIQWPHV